jgi:nucleotide-binding universal stress UspA family protein
MSAVVVGYDSSEGSGRALDTAVEIAGALGDEIVVVFGYAPPGVWGGEIAEHEEAIEELGEKLTGEAKQRAAAQGARVEVVMVPKRGTEALIQVADERDARMIVVGSYGEAPLKGAILGSTPHKLLHLTRHPVLVVPVER